MKKVVFISIFLLLFTSAFSQRIDHRSIRPPQGKSLVYILRPSLVGFALNMRTFCDGQSIGFTKGKTFIYTVLEPGEHVITSQADNKDVITINTEANKTYFIKQAVKAGTLTMGTQLLLLNATEGRRTLMKCKLSKGNAYLYGGNQTAIAATSSANTGNIDRTPPQITITSPNVSRGFKVVKENQVTIIGKAIDKSGIFEVFVNGEKANLDANGNFSKKVLLAVGKNSFTVKAIDVKQNETTESFVISRESGQEVAIANPVEQTVTNHPVNSASVKGTGKYYALIIGNNYYQDNAISSLNEPINDANALFNVLTSKYTFEPENITFLKNATYVQTIEAFDALSNKITENDNLLVFYAGHGWWDESKNLGYWLPTDAKKSSTAFWIANSRISDYMSSINTKHTLLIADACFSGSIFKTRAAFSDAGQAINSLYSLPSRTAMTSGNLKEVPDKSVFLQYLVKRLHQNSEKYLTADQLFVSFRIAVMNNSQTEPQFGTIQNAGDEGGEFIFIRK